MSNRESSSASAIVPPSLALLADPSARYVDGAAMDYFMTEMVNTLRESSIFATSRVKEFQQEMVEAGLVPPLPTGKPSARDSAASLKDGSVLVDEDEDAIRTRLDAIGMHFGANFTERLCRDRPMLGETLDVVKFICKDVWTACWDKQDDNLRTNHRGVYVLQDNAFKPITRLSSWQGKTEATKRAKLYVATSAGFIKGSLSRLGLNGYVVPEITSLPQCTFQVKLPKTSS